MKPDEDAKKLEKEGKIKVLVWPDYTWCKSEDLEEHLISGAGDDYMTFYIPEEITEEDIGAIILDSGCQDFPQLNKRKGAK